MKTAVNFFNTTIDVKTHSCSLNGKTPRKISPYVNLYINTSDICQANCKFCEFRKDSGKKFDLEKLVSVINELNDRNIQINKINFSGGEPTVNFPLIEKIFTFIPDNIYTTINTNGFNFNEIALSPIIEKLSCISLSRHHYDDEKNNEVFGCPTPTLEDIKNFEYKKILHLRCNLIKGFIDSQAEVFKYIDELAQVGVYDFGFVSLMQLNGYCKNSFIDYNIIKYDEMPRTRTLYVQERKGICNCKNYLYYTEKGDLVKMYSRVNSDITFEASNLVYNIDTLQQGFNGRKII